MRARATNGLPELRRGVPLEDAPARRALLVLVDVVEKRYPALANHGDRVATLASEIAVRLDVDSGTLPGLRLAARLHDIGKVAVPDGILDKPGRLDAEEWAHVRRHPETGAELLMSSNLDPIARIVLAHHERPDGDGYPYRLRAGEIPLEALIISAADAYDAMVSPRPYRPALSEAHALRELDRGAGSQFDERAVEALSDSRLSAIALRG